MGQGGAHVAQHGGIGQVALPAGDRQLLRHVAEQGVGDAEVAFRVLEVDGIDLVRHGGGAGLARHLALPEVVDGDVGPDVAHQVQQHGVEAHEGVEQRRQAVVGLYLGGQGIVGQAESGDEPFADGGPIDVRIGRCMGVEVADRTVQLARQRQCA